MIDPIHANARASAPRELQPVPSSIVQKANSPGFATTANKNQLTEAERVQLWSWRGKKTAYPEASLAAVFAATARAHQETLAVRDGWGTELTYGELDERSNQLARYLREKEVGLETAVGLCVGRSAAMVVAVLAIIKAGSMYVPLDAEYPIGRLDWMVKNAGIEVIVTEEKQLARLPNLNTLRKVSLDGEKQKIAQRSKQGFETGAGPDNLAYVMYTSGSTGVPKGVEVTQRGVVRLVKGADFMEWGSHEVVLQMAPMSFDLSTLEIWGALLNGSLLTVMKPGRATLKEIAEVLQRERVSVLWLTAPLFQLMAEEMGEGLRQVRQVLAGGDVLPLDVVRKYVAALPQGHCLINGYGPTEVTTFTACYRMKSSSDIEETLRSVPIGRPIENTLVYIVNDLFDPCRIGEVGELLAGGDGTARGYRNSAMLTAERFVPDPFSHESGARLHRTGDLARWLADGRIEFLGRSDGQVKVRGFRIEIGEVEIALRSVDGVKDAVVVARGEGSEKRLVAYVIRHESAGRMSGVQLRAQLEERLPEYMVPALFVEIQDLPLTASGKIDRRELPAPETLGVMEENEYIAPRNSREEILCRIWAEVLGIKRVSVHDNFFVLGGHSLLGTRVLSRVAHTFAMEVPLAALFESPTIAEFADKMEPLLNERNHSLPSLQPVGHEKILPLSPAQRRLWFLDQLHPESAAYNITEARRIEGPFDENAIRWALSELVRCHEIFRTSFSMEGDEPKQEIGQHVEVPLRLVIFPESERADTEHEMRLRELIAQETQSSFDLGRCPLLRSLLLRVNGTHRVLVLSMHHIIADGWSLELIWKELFEAYQNFGDGKSPRVLPMPVHQYADYIVWQQSLLQSPVLEKQLKYWKDSLSGAPPELTLPTSRPRPRVQFFSGATARFDLDQSLVNDLRGLGRREGLTLFMLLLGCFQALLRRYTGQGDIVVGSPVAGRSRVEAENLIGFFVNTLVLRGDLSGNPTFRDVLRRVRSTTLAAYANQDIPFDRLAEELQPERDLSRNPFFQIMFIVQSQAFPSSFLPGVKISPISVDSPASLFDLTLSLSETGEQISGFVEYNTDLFDAVMVRRLVKHYQTLLKAMTRDSAQRILDSPLLDDRERRQVLEEWNATAVEIPNVGVQCLFEEQAQLRPEAIAVVSGEAELSYGELNGRSNRLAHYLRSNGVRAETRVGLCCERSVEMIVGMLGIVKAGGVYVPLDASYPKERLSWMLQDAQVEVLLTAQGKDRELPEGAKLRLRLDEEWEGVAKERAENPAVIGGGQNLAYIIYTSGSTGEPKGVAVEHRGIVRLVRGANFFEVSPDDAFLQYGSMTFDVSTFEIWGALANGARLVMAPPHVLTLEELGEVIERSGVTVLWLTAGLFQQVVETQLERLRGVRQFLAGGDVVSLGHMRRVGEAMPECALINGYGPTENTTFTTCYRRKGDPGEMSSFPIGKAISNTTVYVLDEAMQPVAVGMEGELYAGGIGLARGYVGKADLTAEKFVPNPFSGKGGERLYGTGDVVKWREDGSLEYVGRKDQQVKVRGYRIELGEIEAELRESAGVKQAVVVARAEEGCDKRLVAYVVKEEEVEGAEITESEMRRKLQQRLPEYMIPAVIVQLHEIPLNASGKFDRKKLTEMAGRATTGKDTLAPRDFVELELTRLCHELLGKNRIGVRDNFFDLGGHSLLAIRFISMIDRTFKIRIPLATIFQHPSIQELAELLRQERTPIPVSAAIELKPGSKRPLFFVHGAGGSAFSFVDLARSMDVDRRFVALQDLGVDQPEKGDHSIESMAAEYVDAIRNFQPEGPYLLGGWSMGGLIAYEMARLLQSRGESIAFLGLVDSYPPSGRKTNSEGENLGSFLMSLGIRAETASLIDENIAIESQLEIAYQYAIRSEAIPSGLDLLIFERLFAVYCSHVRAAQSYRPRRSDLTPYLWQASGVSLVSGNDDGVNAAPAKSRSTQRAAAERRWQKLTPAIRVNRIPGDHFSVLREPSVRLLANALDLAMETAEIEFIREASLTG